MAPVEGERFFNGRSRGRLDAIEPGDSQDLLEMHPLKSRVTCKDEYDFGSIHILRTHPNASVSKQYTTGEKHELICNGTIVFSGKEKVTILLDYSERGFIEEWVLWHTPDKPKLPEKLLERYPRNPLTSRYEGVTELRENHETELI